MATCRSIWRLLTALVWCGLATAAHAAAQDASAPCAAAVLTLPEAASLLRVDAALLEQLASDGKVPGRRLGTVWRFECAGLLEWLRGQLSSGDLHDITGRGLRDQQPPPGQAASDAAGDGNAPVGEAPEDRTAEQVFLRGNRLLLAPGEVVIDVGQYYARRDSPQLALVGNAVTLGTTEQTAFTSVLVGRVGIFTETELFAGTSYSTQGVQQLSGGTAVGLGSTSAFASANFGARRTVLREGVKRPDVVLSVFGQIPSDDLPRVAGGGLVLIKSLDPVVLFASANYAHPVERTERVPQPADTVDVTLGYGLALNDVTAVSMAVSGVFAETVETTEGAVTSPSVFSIRFSVTTAIGRGLYLEPSVSFGLSGPGQSFAFGITMPLAF